MSASDPKRTSHRPQKARSLREDSLIGSEEDSFMKRILAAIGLGVIGSMLLLATPFILPVGSATNGLSLLAHGPGNQFFGWLREYSHVGPGEGAHHAVVLATSLMFWWLIGGVAAYFLVGRSCHD